MIFFIYFIFFSRSNKEGECGSGSVDSECPAQGEGAAAVGEEGEVLGGGARDGEEVPEPEIHHVWILLRARGRATAGARGTGNSAALTG